MAQDFKMVPWWGSADPQRQNNGVAAYFMLPVFTVFTKNETFLEKITTKQNFDSKAKINVAN